MMTESSGCKPPTATPSSWRRVDGVEGMIQAWARNAATFDSCRVPHPAISVTSNAGSSVGTASRRTSRPYRPRRPAPGRSSWPIRWWWPSSATTTRCSTTGSFRRGGGRRRSLGGRFVAASVFFNLRSARRRARRPLRRRRLRRQRLQKHRSSGAPRSRRSSSPRRSSAARGPLVQARCRTC